MSITEDPDEKLTYPGGGLTTERTSVRLSRAVLQAAVRAAQKIKPTHKPHWWLSRWIEIGAKADGVRLYDVDSTNGLDFGGAEYLDGSEWTPCEVLALGPERVTIGVQAGVITVDAGMVRRVGA